MLALSGGRFKRPYAIPLANDVPDEDVSVDAFCMDVAEVTVDDYAACVRSGRCTADHARLWTEDRKTFAPSEFCNYGVSGKGNHPMNCVDWDQATAYCRARNDRLPTQHQCEWAARGGSEGRVYPWGNTAPETQLCWAAPQGKSGTCQVGSPPNGDAPGGIHDLAGNVEEWTSTRDTDMLPPNMAGGCVGPDGCRVTCGGSWNDLQADTVRARSTGAYPPAYRNFHVGFRCVR
jgi:formylglycine-generating enzyme required for sulfatase activity